MSLKNRISDDIKTAMKAKDAKVLSVLRMVLSEIKYAQAQTSMQTEIDDATCIKIATTYTPKMFLKWQL